MLTLFLGLSAFFYQHSFKSVPLRNFNQMETLGLKEKKLCASDQVGGLPKALNSMIQ